MSISLRIQLGVLLVCLFLVPSDYILVTKHKPKATKQSSGNINNKSRVNETVREKYTTGVCQEGNDDLTLYKQTHEQCFAECRSRSLCTAINFYTKVGVCRLNLQKNLTTKVCQKYIFSEKKNWKQRSIPGCENEQCPKTHKCTVRQGKPICFATDCENIKSIAHGVMFGNLVEVGKSRGFQCNKGYNLIGSKKITCQPNGQWSDKVPVCAAVATTTAKHDTRTSATASQRTSVKPSQAPSSRTTTPETPPPSSAKQTKITTTTETPPPSSTKQTKTTKTTETPQPSSTKQTKTTTTTEIPPPSSTTPTKTTATTETSTSLASSATPTATTTTEPNRTGQNKTGNKAQSDASPTKHLTTNTLPTYTSYPNTDRSSTDSTKADQDLTMKDRIDFQYNSHCNTTNQCAVDHLECREWKCQCIFPRVYDPRHDICVEGCSSLGITYQRHDGLFAGTTSGSGKSSEESMLQECTTKCNLVDSCTYLTVDTTFPQKLICSFYENSLSKMMSHPNNSHITFLRDCYDPGTFNTVDSDNEFNDKTYASLTPGEETSEHTETSTDPSKTGESGTDNSDDDLPGDIHESNDDKATIVHSSSKDTSSTDVPGAVQDWQDNRSASAESGLESDENSTATSINVADDLTYFGDAADFINHESCVPGTVYSQIREGCTHDCNFFANTFQFYQSTMLGFSRDEVLGRSSSITECLYNCTMSFRCNAVVEDMTGCNMLYYINGIPAEDKFLDSDDTDAYVRDCE